MGRDRVVVSISLDKDVVEYMKKLRNAGLNISRFVENAIRQYMSSSSMNTNQGTIDNNVVVIKRDLYFNTTCRDLLKVFDDKEVFSRYMRTEYSNALSLMHRICRNALQTQSGGQGGQK